MVQCTIRQKQSKDSQTAKDDHWCTNHHISTQSPPNTQSPRPPNIHSAAQTPLPCEAFITHAWAVATARRPWAGLTVCVYMDVHASGYLLMMSAARLVCQRPSSNFPYFRTPLASFLLSRPNSVEYGNSKTTTLLPRLNVRVHSSKVELAAAGVHPVGIISSHASV